MPAGEASRNIREDLYMSVNDSVIDRYIAIWNEPDAAQRRDLISWAFTEEAVFQDPVFSGEGHAGIETMLESMLAQLPGSRLALIGEPDIHHDWARFRWELFLPDGAESFIEGTDIGHIGDDGRFEELIGFLDKVPAGMLA